MALTYGKTIQDFDALVDSGSDVTLSYAAFGRILGMPFEDKTFREKSETLTGLPFEHKIEGIGKDSVPVYVAPATLTINGKEILASIHWIREKFNPENDFAVVLGQDTIFSLFDVHFSKRQHKFFINDEVFAP